MGYASHHCHLKGGRLRRPKGSCGAKVSGKSHPPRGLGGLNNLCNDCKVPLKQSRKPLQGNELSMTEVSRLPKPVAASWEWQQQGACRSLPTEMFFHPENERGPRRKAREMAAKAVCNTCPVIAECRAHALAVQEPYGIWGGLSEEERLEIISRSTRRGMYSVS